MSGETPVAPDLRAATLEGLRWLAIARPVIEIVLMASMVVLARLIPPAEFGHFVVAAIVAELAVLLPSEGVGAALVQRPSVSREHLQAGFAMALLIAGAVATLAALLATVLIAPVFGARTAALVRLSLPVYVLSALGVVPFAILRRRLAFRLMSMIDVCATLTRAVASVTLALLGLEAEALVFGGLAAALITVAIAIVAAPPPLPRLRRRAARDVLNYGLPASLAATSWVGFRNCDYAIVGARLGALQAGLYFRAYTLAVEYQKKVSVVMSQIGFPVLARTESREQLADLRQQMVRALSVILFPLLALLAITAPVLVPWLFGREWTAATAPTQVLALGGAATLVIDAVGAALMAQGRARALLGFGIAHFAVYAGSVLALSSYGLTAVAAGAAAVHTAFLIVAYGLLLRGTPERALASAWGDLAPAVVACLGLAAAAVPIALVLTSMHVGAFPYLALTGCGGLAAYQLTLRSLCPEAWRSTLRIVVQVLPDRRVRWRWRTVDARST